MPTRATTAHATVAVAAILLATPSALAFDPTGNEVADRFLSILEAQTGTEVTVSGARESGGVTTIEGFSSTSTEDGETTRVTASTIAITDGELAPDGGLTASELSFETLDITAEGGETPLSLTIAAITVGDVAFPSPERVREAGLSGDETEYGTLEMTALAFAFPGGPVTVERVGIEGTDLTSDVLREGSLEVEAIAVPLSAIEDEAFRSQLQMLGYDGLAIDVAIDGAWRPTDGDLELRTVEVHGHGMGTLTLIGALGGLTQDVVDRLQADEQDPDASMALMNEITVGAVSLAYEDEGLAPKALAMVAEQQGLTAEEFAAGLSQALPMMLSAIGNRSFEQQVAEAVSSFLQDPKSIRIAAAPAGAVPVAQIVGAAMMAPQSIPNLLGVTVTAGD